MEFIRTFFTLNKDIIYFGYGLVFFILGLAIALHSRTYSRLDIARSLKWLAAFGFSHGFHEWGDLFIPIQSAYLDSVTVSFLHSLHLALLALSYAFLFEFGTDLLRPLGRGRWLQGGSAFLFTLWFLLAFFGVPGRFGDPDLEHNIANALARYFIGFPGALLAGFGLREHTMYRIAPLRVPHIVSMLRFSGIMLVFYGVLGGLLVPPVPYFPGNFFNTTWFEAIFIAPVPVFRSLIGLGLAVAVIRALEVFDVETARRMEAMEQQLILSTERDRLARELHDGAIQKVYTAGLLVESAQHLSASDSQVLSGRLEKAAVVLDDAIGDLRRNLGELHTPDLEKPFADLVVELANDPRFSSLVTVSLKVDLPEDETLTPARAGHVIMVIQEALANVVRHARARRVELSVRKIGSRLLVIVRDDGIGLPEVSRSGYGLRNMNDRARLLGGQLETESKPGKGTQVVLDVPWRDER